jgi:hypothetical protein
VIRSLIILTLAGGLAAACSETTPPQSAGANQTPSTPPAAEAPATTPPAVSPAPGAQTPPAPPSAPAPPPQPPAPKFKDVTVPAGTKFEVTVLSALASDKSTVEDQVKGALANPIVVEGTTALPANTPINGTVIEVHESGRVKGKASVSFRFERLSLRGETIRVQMARVMREAAQDKKQDVKRGGVGAGLGAIVGGVIGGGKGAAIGAAAGGTGAVLGTKGNEVQIEPGTVVTALLQEPVTVSVPIE